MNKKVVITGAAGNLGHTVVQKFIESGYHVLATVRSGNTIGILEGHPQLEVHQVDLLDENACKVFIAESIKKHAMIDAGIMLAGGYAMGNILDVSSKDLIRMYELNFLTAFHVAQPLFKVMRGQPQGGRLLLIGSRPAMEAASGKDTLAYSLSKSLIFRLAELLNAQPDSSIVASVLVPGIIDTQANREAMPEADYSHWVTAGEIADVMLFLCGPQGHSLRDPVFKLFGKG